MSRRSVGRFRTSEFAFKITNRAEDGMIFVVKFAQAKFRRANIIITIQVNRVRPLLFR